MLRRTALKLAAAGIGALSQPALARDRRATTLRFVPNGPGLSILDPVWTSAVVTGIHANLIYDTLYGLDSKSLPQPQAAAGHEVSDDGRRWVITLREGLYFHDGEKVRAIDAVASLQRWGKRDSFGQQLFSRVDELRALDDRRLEFRLSKPFALLPAALARPVHIMPERVAKTDPFKQVTETIGSGPWKFLRDEWVTGVSASYAKFDRYQPREEPIDSNAGGKVAHFERVEWKILPDPSTAFAALQANEVDWIERPLFDLLPSARRSRGLRVDVFNTLGRIGIAAINHLYPPFDNPEIRRAVLAAINQDEIVAGIVGAEAELGQAGVGYFTIGSPYASREALDGLFTGPRDLPALRARIRAAGYGGEKVQLLSPADMEDLKTLAHITGATFEAIGLNVEFLSMDWGSLLTRRANANPPAEGGWNAHTTTWTGLGKLNPAAHLPLRGNGRQAWSGWPTSPDIERLRDGWFDAPDLPAQQAITRELQRVAVRDVPYLPLGQWAEPTLLRNDLAGLAKTSGPTFWGLRRT